MDWVNDTMRLDHVHVWGEPEFQTSLRMDDRYVCTPAAFAARWCTLHGCVAAQEEVERDVWEDWL